MAKIEIDGQTCEAEDGSMIIAAADALGVHIPRFCYHDKLSIAANCRMCLVEVENAPKTLPACATPVADGMKVFTRSAKAKESQKAVMEFLLINHPLDCPICDQGGECELQDVAMGYGKGISRFSERKRAVKDDDLGSLVATEMTRCIHCTRCVRFGEEIAGIREIGLVGRGEHARIGTYIQHSMHSEVSGNIIDVCPVGALTSKPFRYEARAWEMQQRDTVSPHDCMGSNLCVHERRGDVLRVVPKENDDVNEVWISDRDRFSYLGLRSGERVKRPMIKHGEHWQEVDWQVALDHVAELLKATVKEHGAEQLGALASPSATTEELFLLQCLVRHLGSNNIDHRIHQTDFRVQDSMPAYPKLGMSIPELADLQALLLVGSNIQKDQPVAALRLIQAAKQGAQIMSVNPINYTVNFSQTENVVVAPADMVAQLAGIAKALSEQDASAVPAEAKALMATVTASEEHKRIANNLKSQERAAVLLGPVAINHPDYSELHSLAALIAKLSDATIGCLTEGGNCAGAWLAGAVPHRQAAGEPVEQAGLDACGMLEQQLKAYVLWNIEPELDCAYSSMAIQTLKKADFVVMCSPFKSEKALQYADVILPIAPFAETSGTYVNAAGTWQSFQGAVSARDEVRPGWKVLRVLSNLLEVAECEYMSSAEVCDALQQQVNNKELTYSRPAIFPEKLPEPATGLQRVTQWSIYGVDNIVRRSDALQAAMSNDLAVARVNRATAERLNFLDTRRVVARQDDDNVAFPLVFDERVPDDCVWLARGLPESVGLGVPFGPISLEPYVLDEIDMEGAA